MRAPSGQPDTPTRTRGTALTCLCPMGATRTLGLAPTTFNFSPLSWIVSGSPGLISVQPRCLPTGLLIEHGFATAFIHRPAAPAG